MKTFAVYNVQRVQKILEQNPCDMARSRSMAASSPTLKHRAVDEEVGLSSKRFTFRESLAQFTVRKVP